MEKQKKFIVVPCRHCQEKIKMATPEHEGMFKVTCPKCNKANTVNYRIKKTKALSDDGQRSKGCLEVVRLGGLLGGWGNKTFDLRVGTNTVGREDEELPSDIQFRNDSTMSRRSISIEVIQKEEKGYLFKMKVLRAANPVLHNDKPLTEGEAIYLNYGDSIVLGRTRMRFKKSEK